MATRTTSSVAYQANGGVVTASAAPVIARAPRQGWFGSVPRKTATATAASTITAARVAHRPGTMMLSSWNRWPLPYPSSSR
jgi:hypothetical protein